MVKTRIDLEGVPETLLWNLYHRAVEARRPGAVLHDPWAVELVDAIDYPFQARFGPGARAQWQALRARCFDDAVRTFLRDHPDGTVVALGEGLETQFRRVDNGRVRWVTVDLPEAVDVRRRLLPDGPRQRTFAGSALDFRWMDEVDPSRGVLLTAQGLLMYLEPEAVAGLMAACAERFPGATLVFDAVPGWFSARTLRGEMRTAGYTSPPTPWALEPKQLDSVRALHPGILDVEELTPARGRGLLDGVVLPLLYRTILRNLKPISIFRVRFAPTQPLPRPGGG